MPTGSFKKSINSEKNMKPSSLWTLPKTYHAKGSLTHKQAYYSRNKVNIHPMVIVINRDSLVAISDDLTHDSALVYISPLMALI